MYLHSYDPHFISQIALLRTFSSVALYMPVYARTGMMKSWRQHVCGVSSDGVQVFAPVPALRTAWIAIRDAAIILCEARQCGMQVALKCQLCARDNLTQKPLHDEWFKTPCCCNILPKSLNEDGQITIAYNATNSEFAILTASMQTSCASSASTSSSSTSSAAPSPSDTTRQGPNLSLLSHASNASKIHYLRLSPETLPAFKSAYLALHGANAKEPQDANGSPASHSRRHGNSLTPEHIAQVRRAMQAVDKWIFPVLCPHSLPLLELSISAATRLRGATEQFLSVARECSNQSAAKHLKINEYMHMDVPHAGNIQKAYFPSKWSQFLGQQDRLELGKGYFPTPFPLQLQNIDTIMEKRTSGKDVVDAPIYTRIKDSACRYQSDQRDGLQANITGHRALDLEETYSYRLLVDTHEKKKVVHKIVRNSESTHIIDEAISECAGKDDRELRRRISVPIQSNSFEIYPPEDQSDALTVCCIGQRARLLLGMVVKAKGDSAKASAIRGRRLETQEHEAKSTTGKPRLPIDTDAMIGSRPPPADSSSKVAAPPSLGEPMQPDRSSNQPSGSTSGFSRMAMRALTGVFPRFVQGSPSLERSDQYQEGYQDSSVTQTMSRDQKDIADVYLGLSALFVGDEEEYKKAQGGQGGGVIWARQSLVDFDDFSGEVSRSRRTSSDVPLQNARSAGLGVRIRYDGQPDGGINMEDNTTNPDSCRKPANTTINSVSIHVNGQDLASMMDVNRKNVTTSTSVKRSLSFTLCKMSAKLSKTAKVRTVGEVVAIVVSSMNMLLMIFMMTYLLTLN